MKNLLYKIVKDEADNLVLWIPIIQGSGILVYFFLAQEPGLTELVFLCTGFIFISIVIRNRILIIVLIGLLCGFLAPAIKTLLLATPTITDNIFIQNCRAKVIEIRDLPKYKQLVLDKINGSGYNLQKIRLTVRAKLNPLIKVGDEVIFSAALNPLPSASSDYSYDFAKLAYFQGISAIGYSTADITLYNSANKVKIMQYIESLRSLIYYKLHKHLDNTQANILSALLIGKKEGISTEVANIIRDSGISHLFAISGLHIALVAGMFFTFFRFLFALSTTLTLMCSIKKYAALTAIIASFAYLIMAGSPISAQRAFVMVTMAFSAVLFDRNYNGMRSIAFAAFCILLVEPESLLKPSFQMSFAAVLALLAFYGGYQFNNFINHPLPRYFIAIIMSSITATIATMPYTIYNFNSFSLFGIAANLIAIPVATFIILPVGIVYLVLMPFNIEWIFAPLLRLSIDSILYVAKQVASLSNATIYVKAMPDSAVIAISLGLLWLCLWQSKWRYSGILLVFTGCIIWFFHNTPDMLIDEHNFVIKEVDGQLYSIKSRRSKNFVAQSWIKQNGQKALSAHKEYKNLDQRFSCNDDRVCKYHKENLTVLIASEKLTVERYCREVNLIIQVKDFQFPTDCKVQNISYDNLKKQKSHAIWLQSGRVTIKNYLKNRPWYNSNL